MSHTDAKLEFHILQSFPSSCLNRDDVGAPKSCIVGGTRRSRISSQAWKRPIRMTMSEMGLETGIRSVRLKQMVEDAVKARMEMHNPGAEDNAETAAHCGDFIASILVKDEKKGGDENNSEAEQGDKENKTLIFVSPREIEILAQQLEEHEFVPEDLIISKLPKSKRDNLESESHNKRMEEAQKSARTVIEKMLASEHAYDSAMDIALFGRMVAKAPELNVEGAASVAHAISTHRSEPEIDFFTAVDDLKAQDAEADKGAAHMGATEHTSATFYRYICINLSDLQKLYSGLSVNEAIEHFTKALFAAIPQGRQSTMAAYTPWDYARVLVRKGQPIQANWDAPVKSNGEGYSKPSIERLKQFIANSEASIGSLYGKIEDLEWTGDNGYSIDDLASDINKAVENTLE